MQGYALRLWRI